MILNLNGYIDENTPNILIDFIVTYRGEQKQIYFSSEGGWISESNVMLDVLNNCKNEVELIGYNSLSSCAFELFFKAECKKRILYGTRGMLHFAKATLDVNQKGHITDKYNLTNLKENTSKRNDELIKKLKLTPKEISKYNKGGDVEFTYNRMLELLNNDTI